MIPYQPSRAIGVRAPGALGAPRVAHTNNRPPANHTANATSRRARRRQANRGDRQQRRQWLAFAHPVLPCRHPHHPRWPPASHARRAVTPPQHPRANRSTAPAQHRQVGAGFWRRAVGRPSMRTISPLWGPKVILFLPWPKPSAALEEPVRPFQPQHVLEHRLAGIQRALHPAL